MLGMLRAETTVVGTTLRMRGCGLFGIGGELWARPGSKERNRAFLATTPDGDRKESVLRTGLCEKDCLMGIFRRERNLFLGCHIFIASLNAAQTYGAKALRTSVYHECLCLFEGRFYSRGTSWQNCGRTFFSVLAMTMASA